MGEDLLHDPGIRPSEVRIVESEAYADERGTKAYNASLARRHAMTVKNQLVAQGVSSDRIAIVSYGEARPECRAKVRRDRACTPHLPAVSVTISWRRAPSASTAPTGG